MIWFRRILVLPLGILFLLVFLAAMLIFRLNGTVLAPDFYAEQLRKADIYHFVLNDLLASGIDEVREKEAEDLPGGFNENPLASVDLSTQEIVAAVNTAIPPEWLQEQVEQALDQVGKYATGQRDDFQFTLMAGERVTELVAETRDLLIKADAYDLLLDEVVEPKVEEALENEGVLPFRISLSSTRVVDAVKVVVPQDWVEAQVVAAIDEVTPYAVGDRDSFQIRVPVAGRVDAALAEAKELLREADAYDLLYDEVIAPKVTEALGEMVQLPYGIQVSDDEVISAMREVAPPDWVQQQVEIVIDEAGPYLIGTDDHMQITISLVENKKDAVEVIKRLANERLMALVGLLPQCTPEQLLLVADGLPPCIPPGLDILGALEAFGLDVTEPLAQAIDARVPDSFTFTDEDLRQALVDAGSERNVDLLDQVRDVVSQGWVYTDINLRQDLLDNIGDDAIRVLDDVRDALRDGWTYTDVDYRQDLTDAEETDILDDIDTGRDILQPVRTFQWAPYLLALIILVGIGFLGGRRWHSRIAWAAGVVFISSLLIFITTGPVWSAVGSDWLKDERAEVLEDLEGTAFLAAEKGLTMGIAAADDFFSGLSVPTLTTFIIALLIMILALMWPTRIGLLARTRLKLVRVGPPVPEEVEAPPAMEEVPPAEDEVPPAPEEVPPTEDEVPPAPEDVTPTEDETPPAPEDVPSEEDEQRPPQ